MDKQALKRYLATGEFTPAWDAEPMTDLQRHDAKYHPGGYKEGDACKFRKAMGKLDGVDDLTLREGLEEAEFDEEKIADEVRAKNEYDDIVAQYTNPDGTKKDGWLKAPNGQKTQLTEEQWVKVRTPSFKAWFGDWENDPKHASKIVDWNGEPLVVYHGVGSRDDVGFTEFESESRNSRDKGVFFADLDTASWYAPEGARIVRHYREYDEDGEPLPLDNEDEWGNPESIYACFLNIRNPKKYNYYGKGSCQGYRGRETPGYYAANLPERNDGMVCENIKDLGEWHDGMPGGIARSDEFWDNTVYWVRDPSQIKSATDNTGVFSPHRTSVLDEKPTEDAKPMNLKEIAALALAEDAKVGSVNVQFNKKHPRDKVGKFIEVYRSDAQVLALPYTQRIKAFRDLMSRQFLGRTARFEKNGQLYYATFGRDDVQKNIYGDKKSDAKGHSAKINAGASGDMFDLVEAAEFDHSTPDSGKGTKSHREVKSWDYYNKTVCIDGTFFDVLINVRDKGDNQYVYDVQLRENKNIEPVAPEAVSPTSDSALSSGHPGSTDDIVAKSFDAVNSDSKEKRVKGSKPMNLKEIAALALAEDAAAKTKHRFKAGDSVQLPIKHWPNPLPDEMGEVRDVDERKGVYLVEFDETGTTDPIPFDCLDEHGIKYIDGTPVEDAAAKPYDLYKDFDQNLFEWGAIREINRIRKAVAAKPKDSVVTDEEFVELNKPFHEAAKKYIADNGFSPDKKWVKDTVLSVPKALANAFDILSDGEGVSRERFLEVLTVEAICALATEAVDSVRAVEDYYRKHKFRRDSDGNVLFHAPDFESPVVVEDSATDTRLLLTSDIHTSGIDTVDPKGASVVVIAGDLMGAGTDSDEAGLRFLEKEFFPWCREHSDKQIVVTPGNHDKFLFRMWDKGKRLKWPENVSYLVDSPVTIGGVRMFGTPWCLKNRPGRFEGEEADLKERFEKIPEGLDLLITHTPPYIPGDGIDANEDGLHEGSKELTEAILKKKPRFCVCGHVHSGSRKPATLGETTVMNVARVEGDRGEAAHKPRILRIPRNTHRQ